MAVDDETLKQYLADSPPTVVPLEIKPHFEALSDEEKRYAVRTRCSLLILSGTNCIKLA
jgi:hypothetical protein